MVKTKLMETIWYNPEHEAGFGGLSKLSTANGKGKRKTKEWLKSQLAYTLNRPRRIRFPTRKYRTSGIDDTWQLDLMEMIPYASINDGYKYILTCIDLFSRFARAIPLKTKSAKDVSAALVKLFESERPLKIQTDLGKEFYNSSVASLLQKYKIKHYSVYSQFKAAHVERFNRTLRERLAKMFTKNGNKKWSSALPLIIKSYNHSIHRTLGMRPIDVTRKNEMDIWFREDNQVKGKAKYKVDDYVRISRVKGTFIKNFDQNWSEEVFQISNINETDVPVMYDLKALDGEPIKGKFYEVELQVVEKPEIFRIEKIIKTRGEGEHKQYYVKWHGYKTLSWIQAKDIV